MANRTLEVNVRELDAAAGLVAVGNLKVSIAPAAPTAVAADEGMLIPEPMEATTNSSGVCTFVIPASEDIGDIGYYCTISTLTPIFFYMPDRDDYPASPIDIKLHELLPAQEFVGPSGRVEYNTLDADGTPTDNDYLGFSETLEKLQWKVFPTPSPGFIPSNPGSTGQVLRKTATGYEWFTLPTYTSFAPSNTGTDGQYLQKQGEGYRWFTLPTYTSFDPSNTGTDGQYLKKSGSRYQWDTIPTYTSFDPSNAGSVNQVLTREADGYAWADAPISFAPANSGADGDVLTRSGSGYRWNTLATYTSFAPGNTGTAGQVLVKTATGYSWQGKAFAPGNTGTTNQVLTKTSAAYEWKDAPVAFAPGNTGTTDQVLTKTATGYEWKDAASNFNPSNTGTTDQILTKTATGYSWQDKPTAFAPTNSGTDGQYLEKTATGYRWSTIPTYTSFAPENTGTTNQVLTRLTGNNYEWKDAPTGFAPSNAGTTGQVLTRTATGYAYADLPTYPTGFTPSNTGTTGQYLVKTASGYSWQALPTYPTGFTPSNAGIDDQFLRRTSSGYRWETVNLPSATGSDGFLSSITVDGATYNVVGTLSKVLLNTQTQIHDDVWVDLYSDIGNINGRLTVTVTRNLVEYTHTATLIDIYDAGSNGYSFSFVSNRRIKYRIYAGKLQAQGKNNSGSYPIYVDKAVVAYDVSEILNIKSVLETESRIQDTDQFLFSDTSDSGGTKRAQFSSLKAYLNIPTGFNPSNSGSTGQYLKKTSSGYEWATIPATTPPFTPSNAGTTGQYLRKTASAYDWHTIPTYTSFVPQNAGTPNEVLVRGNDMAYSWEPRGFFPESEGGAGQILVKTATGYDWRDTGAKAFFMPSNDGATGQYLRKTATGYSWQGISYNSLTDRPTIPSIGANPQGNATGNLSKILIGATIYDLAPQWSDITGKPSLVSFAPSNTGSTGQVLTKTATGYQWQDSQGVSGSFSPSNTGSTGQVLTKTATGYQWSAGAFTTTDEAKLDGIEAGAEVNPKHVLYFSAQDTDTIDRVDDGEIGFFNDTTQIQSGSIRSMTALYLPEEAASFAVDPTQPSADLDAVDLKPQLRHVVGSDAITVIIQRQSDNARVVLVATTVAKVTGGYKATGIQMYGDMSVVGTGYGWNIVCMLGIEYVTAVTDATLTYDSTGHLAVSAAIARVSQLAGYVKKEELEGKETDRYASYTNAFMAASYRRGSISLFNETTVPTNDDNAVRQPDIDDKATNGVIAFSTFLRTDRDPNNLQWATEVAASEYPTGTVLYISIWNYPSAHVKVTLTSNAAKVGTGDAAFLWATATWDEVNDIPDVVDYGNYFKIAEYEPTDLDLRIPASDILDPPWLRTDGTNVTQAVKDAVQGDNESVTLSQDFRVNTTNVDYYVGRTVASKQLRIRLPSSAANTRADTDLQRLLQPAAWVQIGDWVADITTNFTRSVIGTSLTFAFNYEEVSGTYPTGSDTVKVTVIGEDVHRGQLARQSFKEESPSVAGKGGTQGQVWTRGTGDENADWADAGGGGVEYKYADGSTSSSTWVDSGIDNVSDGDLIYVDDGSATKRFFEPLTATTAIYPSNYGGKLRVRRSGNKIQVQANQGTAYYKIIVISATQIT